MRVGGSAKRRLLGPYSIICAITIWSFLCSFVISAEPEATYSAKNISPPSRFSASARIVETEKGFCVVQDRDKATKECKEETSFVYINLLIGKALRAHQSISKIRDELIGHKMWRLHIEKIPKEPGLFLAYQKTPKDSQIILHYFIDDKDAHTDRYITLTQGAGKFLYVESLDGTAYQDIRNRIEVLFSPEGGCEEEIINAIDGAEKTFDAAVYSFTNIRISDALKRARRRQVAIRLFLNGKRDANKLGKELESYGVRVKYYSKRGSLMHNKFAIIDEERIFSGSYNWTDLAEKENRENLIMLSYLDEFRYEFDYLWDDKERPPPKAHSPPAIRALFSPRGGCENEIIKLIDKVKNEKKSCPEIPHSIKVALYYFTNKDIAKALFNAKENGVDIEIILDKTQKRPSYAIEKYFNLLQKKAHSKGAGHLYIRYYRIPNGMMHNKFAIIGNATVTGSYNWTKSAENRNRENLIILPSVIQNYSEEFDRLWAGAAEEVIIDKGKDSANQPRGPPPPINILRDKLSIPTIPWEEVKDRLVPEKDRSYFWSGITDGVWAGDTVNDIASANNGITLAELMKQKYIKEPTLDFLWENLSAIYAQNSTGEVHAVLGASLRTGNIWESIEKPTLIMNPNVTKIITIDPKTKEEKIIFVR